MEYRRDARQVHLDLLGVSRDENGSVLLLGPLEPGFWATFTASAEYHDGLPDPLDRWSKRVVGQLATDWGGQAIFPSDGPPYPPFISWALTCGEVWSSPVTLLVHARQGLWASFRGAVRVDHAVPGETLNPPCPSCVGQPCRAACPVGALTADGYDLDACHAFLDTPDGRVCMETGCLVRQACPIGTIYGREEDQSAFHMRAFHAE